MSELVKLVQDMYAAFGRRFSHSYFYYAMRLTPTRPSAPEAL
jgi:hypothetical protein